MSREKLADELIKELRAHQTAQDAFDQAAADYLGVNRTDHRCIDILDQHGPMTAGRLAELADLSTGAVTTVLDRLERAGYARRTRDAEDRRRILVELTPLAWERASVFYTEVGERGRAMLAKLPEEQLVLMRDFFRDATAMLDEVRARVTARLKQAS
jgi:DNA-binding MarR family transcriptional regulator